jgi:hypothetical protein
MFAGYGVFPPSLLLADEVALLGGFGVKSDIPRKGGRASQYW